MPTYEYECAKCGERFEMFQSFSAKPLKKHQGCGGSVSKVFHASGIVFKGSGFYATDVRKGASPASTSTSTSSSDSGSDSSSSGSSTTSTSKTSTSSTSKSTGSSAAD